MDWNADAVGCASATTRQRLAQVDRFLNAAATLSDSDWQAIYCRYLADRSSMARTVSRFEGASIDAIMHDRRSDSPEQSAAKLDLSKQANSFVQSLTSRIVGDGAPEEGSITFQVRVGWIVQQVVVILWSLERVLAVPKRLAAAQEFVRLFDGFIEFPELQ